ncbi:MAG: hypothetical protein ACXVLT_06700 [Flavisolibacter sp.]
MARVFTTRFIFNHQVYDAIVTVISHDGDLKFTVKLMDNELVRLLPEGHLKYTGKDGFRKVHAENHLAHSLIQSIAGSVDKYLTIQP